MIGRKRFSSHGHRAVGRWPVAVFAVLMAVEASFAGSTSPGCDTDPVRARAEQDFPRYRGAAVAAEHGVVTLLFRCREGTGAVAIAGHASGTQLATSVTGVELDSSELARISEPLSTWWQVADLQRALAACSGPAASVDLQPALRAAAEAALPHS